MRKISQANFRCIILGVAIFCAVGITVAQLIDLQLVDSKKRADIASEQLIEKEIIPAQRGIIMDRNEEILTNNINNADLIADRKHLREINLILNSLSYNHAVNTPEWSDPDKTKRQRLRIISKCKGELKEQCSSNLSPGEKAAIRKREGMSMAQSNRELDYNKDACEKFFAINDQLVANILFPYLLHEENNKLPNKKITSRQDIINLIAQPEVTAYNRQAKAENKANKRYRYDIILARGLSIEKANQIQKVLSKNKIRGIRIQANAKRSYVTPEMLCHVIGYVNHENVGENGIERYFHSYLAGNNGIREYRLNARGQVLANEDDRYLPAKHGRNIKLTIDMRIQSIAEEELDRGMREFDAVNGCMIIMDPKTGDIIALVNRPAFDLNTKEVITHTGRLPRNNKAGEKGANIAGDFNYACQARYEPGSTMKVLAAAVGIDTGIVNINSVFNCSPYSVLGTNAISDGRFNYGALPVWAILKKSSNPGIARLALRCKWENYKKYLKSSGLGESIDIELATGSPVGMPRGENLVDFSRISFGYSVSLSPLHLAMLYSIIANNGVRMQPRIIKKIISEDGSIYDARPPRALGQVIKPSTAADIRFALESVTEKVGKHGRGTAMRAAIPGFRIGGKTGTAIKIKPGGGYYQQPGRRYTVSFAGIFPINDPKYVIITVIDEPKPKNIGIGGGTIAAPIFRATVERIIELLNIEPSDAEAYQKYLDKKQQEVQASASTKAAKINNSTR